MGRFDCIIAVVFSGKFFHKELTGLSCGKCHGIVEIFLPQKYSPEVSVIRKSHKMSSLSISKWQA